MASRRLDVSGVQQGSNGMEGAEWGALKDE